MKGKEEEAVKRRQKEEESSRGVGQRKGPQKGESEKERRGGIEKGSVSRAEERFKKRIE